MFTWSHLFLSPCQIQTSHCVEETFYTLIKYGSYLLLRKHLTQAVTLSGHVHTPPLVILIHAYTSISTHLEWETCLHPCTGANSMSTSIQMHTRNLVKNVTLTQTPRDENTCICVMLSCKFLWTELWCIFIQCVWFNEVPSLSHFNNLNIPLIFICYAISVCIIWYLYCFNEPHTDIHTHTQKCVKVFSLRSLYSSV